MKNLGYYNGKYDELENMSIPMNDRSHWFGDGVYDAGPSRNYHIFALDDHIERFFNSAALLDINMPVTKQEMKDLLNDLVKKVDTGNLIIIDRDFKYVRPAGAPAFEKAMPDLNDNVKIIGFNSGDNVKRFHFEADEKPVLILAPGQNKGELENTFSGTCCNLPVSRYRECRWRHKLWYCFCSTQRKAVSQTVS